MVNNVQSKSTESKVWFDNYFTNTVHTQWNWLFERLANLFTNTNPEKINATKILLKKAICAKLRLATHQQDALDGIFNRLLRVNNISENQLDQQSAVQKIKKAIKRLDSFGSAPLFDENNQDFVPGENAKNLIKLIFSGQPFSTKIVNWELAKALLFSKNPALLAEVRVELQKYLDELGQKLTQEQYSSPSCQQQGEVLIGNILALYPFFEPDNGSTVRLPQKIDGQWEMVDYQLTLIQMSAPFKGDPYYAYGFTPIDNDQAVPHLSFMGTPPPTTTGITHAEFTDFVPGYAVGETLYNEGKEAIESWVLSQASKGKRVHVYGQSLGGSLGQILAAHLPKAIGKVFAYNPPSLSQILLRMYQDNAQGLSHPPEMNIFCQENDPVHPVGAGWDPRWNVYHVIPESAPNLYEAHIGAFAGRKNVVMLKLTEKDIHNHNISLSRRIYSTVAECLKVPMFAVKGIALGAQILKHNFSLLIGN